MATTSSNTTQCPNCKQTGYCVVNNTTAPSNPVAVQAAGNSYYHCENCQANFTSPTAFP